MHALDNPQNWVQLSSGLLVLILGIFVLTRRPRAYPTVAFGIFAVLFGLHFIVVNASYLLDEPATGAGTITELLRGGLRLANIASIIALALWFPHRMSDRKILPLLAPAIFVSGSFLAYLLLFASGPDGLVQQWSFHLALLMILALRGLEFVYVLRALGSGDRLLRRQLALTSGAIALYTGLTAAAGVTLTRGFSVLSEDPALRIVAWSTAAASIVLALLWLVDSAKSQQSHLGRNLALLNLGMPVLGGLILLNDWEIGGAGLARTLMVFVLGYAILRHRLLGLDVKVKWAIEHVTLASFLALAFLIASEALEQLVPGNGFWVGVVTAGVVAIALRPVQTVANRLAEHVIPGPGLENGSSATATEIYRAAVSQCLKIGRLEEPQRQYLEALALHLGIPRREAAAALEQGDQ